MQSNYQISYKVRASMACVIAIALSIVARRFHLDDALIYARYIFHALQGRGLEFNPGESVNALTSILNTWLVLGLAWMLQQKVLLAQAIVSCVFLVGSVLLAECMVPLAGMLIAAMSLFYFCIGMETSLFVFLLAASIHAYANNKLNWLPALCVLTVLARFEGAALALVIGWQLWKQRRFPSLPSFIPAALLIGFYFAFNVYFYHILLPQSATAKFGQGMSGYWGRWPTAFLRVPDMVFRPFGKAYILILALLILAAFGIAKEGMSKRSEIIVPFLLILGSFYILFNIPRYHWYYGPFLFFLFLYAASLIPNTRAAQWAGFFFAVCLAASAGIDLHKNAHDDLAYANMAKWIEQNTPQNARLASVETGTIGWYCDRNLIDIVGLTTPQNARYTAKRDYSSWFAEQPDFIVVHPGNPFPWEKVALASSDYELLPIHFDTVYLLHRKSPAAHRPAI